MAALLRPVKNVLTKYPLLWNSALYVGLYSAAEITQQTLRGQKQFDLKSIAEIGVLGGFVFAPFNYNWYKILEKVVVGSGPKFIVKKICCDQLIAGSIGIVLFYVGLAALQGRPDVFTELKQKGVQTYKTGCVFWPTVQIANFMFVPPHLRAAYVGCGAFFWSNILCFFKNKSC